MTSRFNEFKTLENLIEFHTTSESIMFLCDLTGISVNDKDFDSLLDWFDENRPAHLDQK